MKMKRGLVAIFVFCVMMTLMTGSTSDASNDPINNARFVSDFKQNGKFCFHGLKHGLNIDEVRKKEKLKKSDLILSKDGGDFYFGYYTKTDEKLYGIDGNVRCEYAFTNTEKPEYANGGVSFYFDDERKFLKACKQIGNLLRKNFGNPVSSDSDLYDEKKIWNSFMNPPKFSSMDDYIKCLSVYANPSLEWDDPSNEYCLFASHSPHVDLKKQFHDKDDLRNYYIIEIVVFS